MQLRNIANYIRELPSNSCDGRMAQYDRDNELRESVRGSLTFWLDKLRCDGNVETTMDYKRRFVEKLRHSPVAVHTDKANEQHYEVPTAFFKTVQIKMHQSYAYIRTHVQHSGSGCV